MTRRKLFVIAMLVALIAYGAVLIRHASFAVGGSDSSGYANAANWLLQGRVRLPIAELDQFNLPEDYAWTFTPLGYHVVLEDNAPTKVMAAMYPIGFPLHLAMAATLAGWHYGPFVVSPLLGTLSLLLLYLIGLRLGLSRPFAIAGAAIMATNPTFIFMALQPMSDITALFWGLVLIWAGLRFEQNDRWALLSGAAFGIAFLVRPTNILFFAPLAFCLRLKPKALLFFIVGGLPMAAVFFGYNFATYGDVLQSGYRTTGHGSLLVATGILARVKHYLYWVGATMSPLIIAGWLGVAAIRKPVWRYRALVIAWFGAFLTFYVFYSVYQEWWYTRFLLPGYPGLILGALLVARVLGERLFAPERATRLVVGASLLIVILGFANHYNKMFRVFDLGKNQAFHSDSCLWADAKIPAKTLVVSSEMSGAIVFYTHRPLVRWDALPPGMWSTLENRALQQGYQFYALLMPHEIESARKQVPGKWTNRGQRGIVSLWQIEPKGKAIQYSRGFSGLEHDGKGQSWSWMSDEGVILLQHSNTEMRLNIALYFPINAFPRPNTVKIFINGVVLDSVTAKNTLERREYIVKATQQGTGEWSELRLVSDLTFVPHQQNPSNPDTRRLSCSINGLEWKENTSDKVSQTY